MKTAPQPHPLQIAVPELSRWAVSANGVPYVHERSGPLPGPEVLISALVHGNEYAGALALDSFLRCDLQPRRGRITAVFCNTAAFATFDAQSPDSSRFVDEDFNRVWAPAQLDGTHRSTELTRAREIRPFVERATHLLDLHSMHEPCMPLLVTGLLPRNIAFAQSLGTASQVIADQGHADGVRMRDTGSSAMRQARASPCCWRLVNTGNCRLCKPPATCWCVFSFVQGCWTAATFPSAGCCQMHRHLRP